MDGTRDSHTEGSQAEKDKYHMIYVESWQKGTNELIYKTESYRCKKHNYQGVRRWGGINWENGIDIYMQLYIKQITNKDLLHSTQ